ncbi:conserved hypothetical protein [Ricinus communis]|uniref:RNase H type-1 domain-containing protein n=1 Tax=Ricinus communis TaxID=3988 RepID=B9SQ01_RICCO|nr:conserved hypothetical protein [Ricinus communis]
MTDSAVLPNYFSLVSRLPSASLVNHPKKVAPPAAAPGVGGVIGVSGAVWFQDNERADHPKLLVVLSLSLKKGMLGGLRRMQMFHGSSSSIATAIGSKRRSLKFGFCFSIKTDSTVAKGDALRWALKIARDCGIRDIEVECGIKVVIDSIHGKKILNAFGDLTVDDILMLANRGFKHVSRTDNAVAHSLAHFVPTKDIFYVWVKEVPPNVDLLVSQDVRLFSFSV